MKMLTKYMQIIAFSIDSVFVQIYNYCCIYNKP